MYKKKLLPRISSAVVLFAFILTQVIPFGSVYAAQITTRSLTLLAHSAISDGGSKPGGIVDHRFDFTIPGGGNIGSIKFQYCTLAAGVPVASDCTMPTGLDTLSASLDADEQGITGWTVHSSLVSGAANGAPYVALAAPIANGGPTTVRVRLNGITNPTNTNETFYVRISTYSVIDPNTGSPASTDTGTVAASTSTQIILDGIMPESLVFCAGATVGVTGSNVPDCTTVTTGVIHFSQLFSSTAPAFSTSQMAASTNAGSGYSITVNGPTLTSGANTITPMGTVAPAAYAIGVSQFGLNLMRNIATPLATLVPFGAVVDVPSNGTNYRGQPTANYGTADLFRFVTGDSVANSANGGAGGSDAQIFTVSYIVDVPGSQPAGTYTTTLTYICTPTF